MSLLLMTAVFVTGLAIWPLHQEGILYYHKYVGWALGGWAVLSLLRPRAFVRFFREISRWAREDLVWLLRSPLTIPGLRPFGKHDGHLDPGQRMVAWLIVALGAVAIASGTLILFSCSPQCGTVYLVSFYAHRVSIALLGFVLVGHVVVSLGIPKPYRGVWRAMHRDGRVPSDVAHRLWPAWAERQDPSRGLGGGPSG